ncbi:MAG: dipeptidase [Gemmatimonadales bacterium]
MTTHEYSRRAFARLMAFAAVSPFAFRGTSAVRPRSDEPGIRRWSGYDDAMVIDCLASPGPFNVPDRIGRPLTEAMLANASSSGITAVNLTVSGGGPVGTEFEATIEQIAYWEAELTRHPDRLMKVQTIDELHRAKSSGKLGLIYGFQDTTALGPDLKRLEIFHRLGIKIIQLTYNRVNRVGDGCLVPRNAGLTPFGKELVAAMNETGILVDTSHCGQQTTADAIAASTQPTAITHSGCSAVYQHPRSKADRELRALADGGGVVGIYMMPFLNSKGPPQAEDFMRHLEHAVNVCGEDHVGVGSDNSITPTVADEAYLEQLFAFADERARLGIGAPREHEVLFVEGLNHPRRMETIADMLLERGHTESRVEKILGGNWERLFGDVWH